MGLPPFNRGQNLSVAGSKQILAMQNRDAPIITEML
jgi:hypothetical protein